MTRTRRIKFEDFHNIFRRSGIGKRYLHIFPDGLIRIKLNETSTYSHLYIEQINYHQSKSYKFGFAHSADRNKMNWMTSSDDGGYTHTFDRIFDIINDSAPDNIKSLFIFNMELI